jgi:hypothetical protein
LQKQKHERKCFIIYPDNQIKMQWDLFFAFLLIYSCLMTPVKIAFSFEDGIIAWSVSENVVDILFGIDMLLTFFCAYLDDSLDTIDDRLKIALNYI